jgi:predicted nucleic acid-binding protein
MVIISDTGPLISLAEIDKLDLLEKLYRDIYIPQAVWTELQPLIEKFNLPVIRKYADKVKEITKVNQYFDLVDYGESEAMSLYEEINADYLLVDDGKARNFAENQSIRCIGTLGVLVRAKNAGLIDALRPLFKTLGNYSAVI